MAHLLILGASGSVGKCAIDAVRRGIASADIKGLVSYSSPLDAIADEFSCSFLMAEGKSLEEIRQYIKETGADLALNAVAGYQGLIYSDILIDLGIDIALANKESIVLGGRLLLDKARAKGVRIIPVDSEHSAIADLLSRTEAESILITASGGPFYDRASFEGITPEEALAHPVWKMGPKVTIDSATLANKGLEVIEAAYLFGIDPERIEVTIHRQSVVHSAVRTRDGAVYALLSSPDMTLPVARAIDPGLSKPAVSPLSFRDLSLTFEEWDRNRFPMLSLAYEALRKGGSYPVAYCRADEEAVKAFLCGDLPFSMIPGIVMKTMESDWSEPAGDIPGILRIMRKAEEEAKRCLREYSSL